MGPGRRREQLGIVQRQRIVGRDQIGESGGEAHYDNYQQSQRPQWLMHDKGHHRMAALGHTISHIGNRSHRHQRYRMRGSSTAYSRSIRKLTTMKKVATSKTNACTSV